MLPLHAIPAIGAITALTAIADQRGMSRCAPGVVRQDERVTGRGCLVLWRGGGSWSTQHEC